jgi:hypothetical protein
MGTRLKCFCLAVYAGALCVAASANAQEPPTPPPPSPPPPPAAGPATEPAPLGQWLDEVRAQRRAWEGRRRAAKDAMDAHRRWIDPWGAAQHEAREQETQRRREAFREKIERDREAFRNQVPWGSLYGPWPDDSMGFLPDDAGAPDTDDTTTGQGAPSPAQSPMPGWDNRWYYRGY